MTFDKTAYQREYMRQRRANGGMSAKAKMTMGLQKILAQLQDSEDPVDVEICAIAREALGERV